MASKAAVRHDPEEARRAARSYRVHLTIEMILVIPLIVWVCKAFAEAM